MNVSIKVTTGGRLALIMDNNETTQRAALTFTQMLLRANITGVFNVPNSFPGLSGEKPETTRKREAEQKVQYTMNKPTQEQMYAKWERQRADAKGYLEALMDEWGFDMTNKADYVKAWRRAYRFLHVDTNYRPNEAADMPYGKVKSPTKLNRILMDGMGEKLIESLKLRVKVR
ncbi:hypothetical protein [Paenibacillus pinihumi]|uniref:hypothetical protein n=1 Tax=Paenibacillus pinihumi TaxID=669462 RepID=UPI000413DB98|nr:hypothetical protein [Paenibacillus pinihumi]